MRRLLVRLVHTLPWGVNSTALLGRVVQPSEPAWSVSFTTQTHTVWLPAPSTLDTTLLTIFSTWMIKECRCQCSAMSLNKESKNNYLQSHFYDRYVLYSFPHFLHLSEQHHIVHLGVVCLKKKKTLFYTLNKWPKELLHHYFVYMFAAVYLFV